MNGLWTRRATLVGGVSAAAVTASGLRAADLDRGEIGVVASVTDGDTLALQSGLRVKLAAITAPARAEAFGREAHEGLAGLLRGRQVQLSYGGDRRDRYDRALAHVHTLTAAGERDLWVQDELIRLGLARVYTWPDEIVDFKSLYRTENESRQRGRGLWANPAYHVRRPDPDPLAQYVESLQIVEGVITSAAEVRGRTYLNFGADYRTDFTVTIAKSHKKRFAGMDLMGLEGARVRVRGWVELINGPMMWANHPARIEILS